MIFVTGRFKPENYKHKYKQVVNRVQYDSPVCPSEQNHKEYMRERWDVVSTHMSA